MKNNIWHKLAALLTAAVLCFGQAAAVFAEEAQSMPEAETPASTAASSEQTQPAEEQTQPAEEQTPESEPASSQEEASSSEEAVSSSEEAVSSSQEEVSSSEVVSSSEAVSSSEEAVASSGSETSSDAQSEEHSGELNNYFGSDVHVGYRQYDPFENAENLKGLDSSIGKEYYNAQHAMNNFFMDEAICNPGEGNAWQYKGRTFYLNLPYIMPILENWVAVANSRNISVSMVFLMRYQPGKEWLLDNANAGSGSYYYAPATTGEGALAVEAMFDCIAYVLDYNGWSIDNWVLGNEVNDQARWNYMGTTDANVVADKYSTTFLGMYNIVRKYTQVSRCSISLDHNWTWSDNGREIPGRDMLNAFNAAIARKQADVDWCVSYHPYPWEIANTDLWNYMGYTPNSPNAMFISGMNLNVLTDYISDNFGVCHRVMITEVGFSYVKGQLLQAAALAVTYYAAKYNPLIDCFIINRTNEDNGIHNFGLASPFTEEVYAKIDNGNAADQAYVEGVIMQASGRDVRTMVPNYGVEPIKPDMAKIQEFVTRLYSVCLDRTPDASGLSDWSTRLYKGTRSGTQVAYGFVFSNEFKARNLCNDCYVEYLYKAFLGRGSDPVGKADWVNRLITTSTREDVFNGFAGSDEFKRLCAEYGITAGVPNASGNTRATGVCSVCGKDPMVGIRAFVTRMYDVCLDRTPDAHGLGDWSNRLLTGAETGAQVAYGFAFSNEFKNKNYNNDDFVERLYNAFFGRGSDPSGKQYWLDYLAAGRSREFVFSGFTGSDEFKALCTQYDIVVGTYTAP